MTDTVLEPPPIDQRLGWRPDLPDWRDLSALPPPDIDITTIPDYVRIDHDPAMPPVYNQLQLGSCTANALAALIQFDLRKQGLPDFMPSRLFIYFCERVLEHSTEWDAGAMLRDGAKVLRRIGVPPEDVWPYDIRRFAERPPPDAYELAKGTRATSYGRVSRFHMQQMLASGTPFALGFAVYSNFYEIGRNGVMPMPQGSLLGGHAVVNCGYDTIDRDGTGDPFPGGLHYRIRNSWGVEEEDGGHFWMPAKYLTSTRLSSDFWAIKTVS